MPSFYFLKIGLKGPNRIIGDTMNATYPGWIEISSYTPGQAPGGHGARSGGAGKSSVSEFYFHKLSSSSSARISLACNTGEPFDGAVFTVLGPGAPYHITFSQVVIGTWQTSLVMGEILDTFTLNFSGINFVQGAATPNSGNEPKKPSRSDWGATWGLSLPRGA
jgi:type VI protein secretion system component Hcp